jgi:hypothetical protein
MQRILTELERSHEVKQEHQGVMGMSLAFTAQERFQRFSKTTQLKGRVVRLQGFARRSFSCASPVFLQALSFNRRTEPEMF